MKIIGGFLIAMSFLVALAGCSDHQGQTEDAPQQPQQRITFSRHPNGGEVTRFDDPMEVTWVVEMRAANVSIGVDFTFSVMFDGRRIPHKSEAGLAMIREGPYNHGLTVVVQDADASVGHTAQFLVDGERMTLVERRVDILDAAMLPFRLTDDELRSFAEAERVECRIGSREFMFNGELLSAIREFQEQAAQTPSEETLLDWYREALGKAE